jgi:hypothetical protein
MDPGLKTFIRNSLTIRHDSVSGINIFFCLFNCGLFNGAVSSSDYVASNNKMIRNIEIDSIWKKQ